MSNPTYHFVPRPIKREASSEAGSERPAQSPRSVSPVSTTGGDNWVDLGELPTFRPSLSGNMDIVSAPVVAPVVADATVVPSLEEASPGIACKFVQCPWDEAYINLTVGFKIDQPTERPSHTINVLLGLDCSGSMGDKPNGNDGSKGLKKTLQQLEEYSKSLDDTGVSFNIGGFNFGRTTWQTEGAENVFVPLKNCASHAQLLANGLSARSDGTNIDAAVATGVRTLEDAIIESNTKNTAGVLVVATDGIANRDETNGEKIALRTQREMGRLPISLHSISLGSNSNAGFLKKLVAPKGLIGYATDPADVYEAFLGVFGKLNDTLGLLYYKYEVWRVIYNEDELIDTMTRHLGFITSENTTGTFEITAQLKPGDKIKITVGKFTTTFVVPHTETVVRPDLLAELQIQKEINEKQTKIADANLSKEETAQATRDLAAYAEEHATPKTADRMRRISDHVTRSLEAPADDADEDEKATFRSLSAPHVFAEVSSQVNF